MPEDRKESTSLKEKIWKIIFEAETPAGKLFDVLLLWFIGLSVLAIMLESVEAIGSRYSDALRIAEYVFTAVFTVEYLVRLWCVRRKRRYIFSFFGIIDLLSLLPSFLVFFIAGGHQLVVIRIIRMLRVFRVLKMARHMGEAAVIIGALKQSRAKITVFLFGVLSVTLIMGTLLYLIEGKESGFTSIPMGVYWAIVTLTTVGYGDISPVTPLGQFIASSIMILGYALLAVPSGIFAADIVRESNRIAQMNKEVANALATASALSGTESEVSGVSAGAAIGGAGIAQQQAATQEQAVVQRQAEDDNYYDPQIVHAQVQVVHTAGSDPGVIGDPHGPLVQPFRCPECGAEGHRPTANHCFSCGAQLRDDPQAELPIWSHSKKPGEEEKEDAVDDQS